MNETTKLPTTARLVIKARVDLTNLLRDVELLPGLLDNHPKFEIWLGDNVCVSNLSDAIKYLRAYVAAQKMMRSTGDEESK